MSLDVSIPSKTVAGEEGASKGGTPYQVWACAVRLSVRDGFSILEYGTNTRSGSGSDGLEMAFKGCITDGVKRCLKAFGDQFGLVLYHKQHDHLLEQPANSGVLISHNRPPLAPKSSPLDVTQSMPPRHEEPPGTSLREKLAVPAAWQKSFMDAARARGLKASDINTALNLGLPNPMWNELIPAAYLYCEGQNLDEAGVDALLDECEPRETK